MISEVPHIPEERLTACVELKWAGLEHFLQHSLGEARHNVQYPFYRLNFKMFSALVHSSKALRILLPTWSSAFSCFSFVALFSALTARFWNRIKIIYAVAVLKTQQADWATIPAGNLKQCGLCYTTSCSKCFTRWAQCTPSHLMSCFLPIFPFSYLKCSSPPPAIIPLFSWTRGKGTQHK